MKRLGSVLPAALANAEVLRAARAQAVLRRWEEVVGPGLAAKSRPDRYDGGTVWVAVEGSAWAQELRMMKGMILERLTELSGEATMFRDVRFGVRPLVKSADENPVVQVPVERTETMTIREIAERRLARWRDAAGD